MKRGFTMALFLGLLLVGAGCSSSKDEIRRVAEESLATALAGVPTITPAPTASPQPTPSPFVIPATPTPFSLPPLPTPLPTATPVTFPPTVTPQPTSTPQPTATPQPTPTPVVFPATPTPAPTPTPGLPSSSGITTLGGQVSGPAVFRLPGDFSLTVNPSEPLAGRDVEFTLTGLPPWQDITVTFTDPLGRPVQWVTENEVVLVGPGDVPVTARNLYADGSGQVNWTRIGAKDQEGTWTVQVTVGGEVTSVTYPVTQLQLPHQDTETVGVELRRYQGSASDAFYSTLVPAATAIDLQAHLVWAVDRLSEDLRVQSPQIPDIYLAGNESLLQQVARATGDEIGYEDGYYRSTGNRPGINMRTNLFLSNLRAVLTHEYTHLLLREVAPDHSLPAWLNEGIARHSEYALGLESANPDALRVLLYRGADLAKSSALSGTLPSLSSLESQTDWNSQVDDTRINLQYAESYMAIRFMVETYGVFAPIDVVDAMGRGSPLAAAMLEVTGSQYRDFRDSFVDWLQDWEDPERAGIRSYLSSLVAILTSVDSISERRAVDLQSDLPFSSRIPIKRGLVVDSQVLVDRLEGLSPPSMLTEVHQDASTYLSAVSQWLTLELEYVETLDQAKLFQANDMIPEINARDSLLLNKVNTVQFVYNLK